MFSPNVYKFFEDLYTFVLLIKSFKFFPTVCIFSSLLKSVKINKVDRGLTHIWLESILSSLQFSRSVITNSFSNPWFAVCQASLSITNSWNLVKLLSIESVMPSNHLILCHPLLPPSIIPSIRVFSDKSVLNIRWPKYWSFNFSISPSNEYSGLISLRMDWLNLLTVQGTLKSLFQHHSSKASILCLSAFFIVQLAHPYTTAEKTIVWLDTPLLAK